MTIKQYWYSGYYPHTPRDSVAGFFSTALYCPAMHYIALYWTTITALHWQYPAFPSSALHYTWLHSTPLHSTTLHLTVHTVLHQTSLDCSAQCSESSHQQASDTKAPVWQWPCLHFPPGSCLVCTVYRAFFTVYSAEYTVHLTLHTLRFTFYSVHSLLYIVN